jgi:hypothetical protein
MADQQTKHRVDARAVASLAPCLTIAAAAVLIALLAVDRGRASPARSRAQPHARGLSPGARGARTPTRPDHPAGETMSGTPFDVGKVMDQVHFAFREEGGAWTGGDATYAVKLEGGTLEVTPFHHGAVGPEEASSDPRTSRNPRARRAARIVEGSAIHFAAAEISRGGVPVASGPGDVSRDPEGGLLARKGAVLERLANGPDGVEQSWKFAAPPEGRDDVEVRIAVASPEFRGDTEHGLHFAAGKLGIRYGHATWIDALGTRTAVPTEWNGREILLRVPAATVDGSVYPAVLDPVISPEASTDEPVTGAGSFQIAPAAAWDGTNYLVVWDDARTGGHDVFGARVSAAGAILDPGGIAIRTTSADEEAVAVAWDGTNHLVVWDQTTATGDHAVYGARVSPAGVLQDPEGIAIATSGATDIPSPAVASDGTSSLVVWEGVRNDSGYFSVVYGARVSSAGVVVDTVPLTVAEVAEPASLYWIRTPAVAWGGTSYLVVWDEVLPGAPLGDAIRGARVGADGVAQAGFTIANAAGEQNAPAVASNGSSFLVVWEDSRNGDWNDFDVYGARVSAGGVVEDASGIVIGTATASDQSEPAVVWDGTNYLVVWQDARDGSFIFNYDVYGARVSASGAVQDVSGVLIGTATNDQSLPAAASSGAGALVVWQDSRNGANPWERYQIRGARVTSALGVQDPVGIEIGTAANVQNAPALARDGTNYLLVWQDFRNGTKSDVYGVRVSAEGVVQDPSGIAISTAANDQLTPAVAWGGATYLVVWTDHRGSGPLAYGARVNPEGVVQDVTGISIGGTANGISAPAVASNGTSFLVTWSDLRDAVPSVSGSRIYATRVRADGTVEDPAGIRIASVDSERPALASDGTSYLVVWERWNAGGNDIFGARVSAEGVVQDPGGIAISEALLTQQTPAIAFDGVNYVVVWQSWDSVGVGAQTHVQGTRVSVAGAVIDAPELVFCTSTNLDMTPSAASDGDVVLVVWDELRPETGNDIRGGRISQAGELLDPDGFPVSEGTFGENAPTLAASGPERFLVAYEGYDAAAKQRRVLHRTVDFGAAAPPAAPADASSGGCGYSMGTGGMPLAALLLLAMRWRRRRPC